MRISLFAHMERTDDSVPHAKLYENFVELCQIADEGGFCGVWVGEHHGMDFTIAPNPFAQLTDLANKTKNLRLGTATVVAPFWHPIKLAGEAAMVDILTEGRLEICLSRGAYAFEYDRLSPGEDAWSAGAKLRELIPAVQELWKGDYEHNGENWQFPKTTAIPKPMQSPHPRMWVAARDPDTHSFAIANGCHVQVTPLWQGDQEIVSLMDKFKAALAENPGVERPNIMLLRHLAIANTEQQQKDAAKQLSDWYNTFGAWFRNDRAVTNGSMEPLSEEEKSKIEMFSPEEMLKNHVIGTAEHAIERLKFYQSLGYDEYSLWLDNGMPHEQKKQILQTFIDEVLPEFERV